MFNAAADVDELSQAESCIFIGGRQADEEPDPDDDLQQRGFKTVGGRSFEELHKEINNSGINKLA